MLKERFIPIKPWTDTEIAGLRAALLQRYDVAGRSLPWRVRPEDRARGVSANPYAVWLSEIMLQQTTVAHASPYWQRFLSEFPTVTDLANAKRERIMEMWAGLGYYARARNLYKCAQMVRDSYAGVFPNTEAELLKLPGIGPYTAAAIAAICFDEATVVVDGNVERVISRMARVETPLPKGKADIKNVAALLADPDRPGDYSQALMDLGATICAPKTPKCGGCVWSALCKAHAAGVETDYPKKLKKTALPKRFGNVFVLISSDGHVLLQQRPDAGLLGGMLGFPGSEWESVPFEGGAENISIDSEWEKISESVRHIFTHFELSLEIYCARVPAIKDIQDRALGYRLVNIQDVETRALPSVMKKVWRAVQNNYLPHK